MSALAKPVEFQIEDFLAAEQAKDLLRFTTAGSVDDGKSTLIGRLLYDSQSVYEDQLKAVTKASVNRSAGAIDFSLLTDGLRAEREQGITIDVAYRYFATARRKFIIADTPGHEQYTRNMATGASTADLAVILIDARNGVLQQSRRHGFIASLLGIPNFVIAVNKMDAVGYDEAVFRAIETEYREFVARLGSSQNSAACLLPAHQRTGRRQRGPAEPEHAVVSRPVSFGVSGKRSGSPSRSRHRVSISGAARNPAGSRLPGLCGTNRFRHRSARRWNSSAALRPALPRQEH